MTILKDKINNKTPVKTKNEENEEDTTPNKRKSSDDNEYVCKVTELIKKARIEGENERNGEIKEDDDDDLFW